MNNILKIAHRGASGYEPENTLSAFEKAIELGADMVELDIHLCKTGEAIVMHDETVNRTTNGHGRISSKSLEEIKELTINSKEEIPTLQQVIDITKGRCGLDIEVKDKKAAERVIELIQKNRIQDSVIVSSSYLKPLKTIKKHHSDTPTALIFYSAKSNLKNLLIQVTSLQLLPITQLVIIYRAWRTKSQWIHLKYPIAQKNFIKLLHKLNYKVAVWVINSHRQINKMKQKGVDAIISNYPDRL